MVYSLISEKGLPATKVTGKWLFPINLVRQWVEAGTENYPQSAQLPPYHGLVLIAGSNDLLLDKLIATFNIKHEHHMAMFGMAGSLGGLNALKQNLCHIASSHLIGDNDEYNFPFLKDDQHQTPAVVNLCQREQGIVLQKGNPKNIGSIKDLSKPDIRIVNRQLGTGTRKLFDKVLLEHEIKGDTSRDMKRPCPGTWMWDWKFSAEKRMPGRPSGRWPIFWAWISFRCAGNALTCSSPRTNFLNKASSCSFLCSREK